MNLSIFVSTSYSLYPQETWASKTNKKYYLKQTQLNNIQNIIKQTISTLLHAAFVINIIPFFYNFLCFPYLTNFIYINFVSKITCLEMIYQKNSCLFKTYRILIINSLTHGRSWKLNQNN